MALGQNNNLDTSSLTHTATNLKFRVQGLPIRSLFSLTSTLDPPYFLHISLGCVPRVRHTFDTTPSPGLGLLAGHCFPKEGNAARGSYESNMASTTDTIQLDASDTGPERLADNEDSWYSLIERVKARAVIPVIGPELLDVTVQSSDGASKTGSFYRLVSEALCTHYGIAPVSGGSRHVWDLHAAVAAVIADKEKSAEKVRRATARIVNSLCQNTIQFPSLSVLAKIDAFDFFVSLTCDDLLGRALAPAHLATFSPRAATGSAVDIPAPHPNQRVVFQIFGAASSLTDFAIHEEDALEYLFALQSEGSRRLPIALSELRKRDLLFIGCNLPDWMGRSLLRLVNDDRLYAKSTQEFFSDTAADPSLTAFFSRFSPNTMSFGAQAGAFADELAKRWSATSQGTTPSSPVRSEPSTSDSAGPTAFISYASENNEAARCLADALRNVGFSDVWLDRKKLIAGDDWSLRIDEAIQACDFFLPLLSREADKRREGVYWAEWDEALMRSRRIPDEFIVPVGVDQAPPSKTAYPRISGSKFIEFFSRDMVHAPGGVLSDEAKAEMRERARRFLLR